MVQVEEFCFVLGDLPASGFRTEVFCAGCHGGLVRVPDQGLETRLALEGRVAVVHKAVDGDVEGDTVGDADGDVVGNLDGDSVGDAVGEVDGDTDGDVVGDLDGDAVGDVDGDTDGDTVSVTINLAYSVTH